MINKKIILNGEIKSSEETRSIISALSTREILIRNGGFIFNFSLKDTTLSFTVLPFFINRQRTHHYDIHLSEAGKCILYGFVNSNKTVTILFKSTSTSYVNGFLPGMAELFRKNYVILAIFMIKNGFQKTYPLDIVTKNLLEESKLFKNIPSTIQQLAEQKEYSTPND
ncbi:MAG: hypothetical protein U9O87_04560 [Verrucomicrobiota bacterium]|nr:hypothetical protein [Verrucomicrobiota bacterium]